MIWMNEAGRAAAKAAGKESIGEIGKHCGAMWKEMAADEKAKWEDKA